MSKNVNLNEMVEVELTEYGREILIAYYPSVESWGLVGNTYQTQLHSLFHIFGQYCYVGNPKVPFVDNVIKFL